MESLRKGLKKGDLFEDGGRAFVVVEVNQDGTYLSELWCPKEKTEAAVAASEGAAGCVKANLNPQDLEKLSVKELKKLAKDMGLYTFGTKAELVERIAAEEVEIDPQTTADQEEEETGNGPEEETEE
ncbi:MAG: SAP domain-containing protein [Anaerovoracaceae bacterium]